MKKYIFVYLISGIALIITQVLVYKMTGKIDLIFFLLVNLLLPSLIVIVANIVLNDKNSNIKTCFIHAVLLSMLSLAISMGSTQLLENQKISEPYRSAEDTSKNNDTSAGTWDIQVEKDNHLSVIMSIFLDILLAFLGGSIGVRVKKISCNSKYFRS